MDEVLNSFERSGISVHWEEIEDVKKQFWHFIERFKFPPTPQLIIFKKVIKFTANCRHIEVKNILLVGVGQLASLSTRFSKLRDPVEIFVVDPNEKSLKTAQLRWEEVANGNALHRVHFLRP